MWKRLVGLASGALVILFSRWGMNIAKPQQDIRALERVTWTIAEKLHDYWSILWRAYGPITAETRAAWSLLRRRYQSGAYDTQGT